MGLTSDDVQALLEAFETSSWQEMTVEVDGDRVHVSRRVDGSAPAPAPIRAGPATSRPVPTANSTPAPPQAAAVPTTTRTEPAASGRGQPVNAPSIGLFWRSPSPGAPPFVEVGSRIGPDDTIAIIEVMKLMSPLTAGMSGVITAILVENGATVARGEPLVLVDTEA